MPLSNFDTLAEDVKGRILDGYVIQPDQDSDGNPEVHPMGHLQDITISYSPVTQDADVKGREKQIAMDVEVTLVMQQTAQGEFQALTELVQPTGQGRTIKLVDRLTAKADVPTTTGHEFVNVFPMFEGEFDGSGEGSSFTVTFGGRVLPQDASLTSVTFA